MPCQNCKKEFNPADRAQPTAQEGSIAQIKYCSLKCKRQANNRRNYQRNKATRQTKARRRQRAKRQGESK